MFDLYLRDNEKEYFSFVKRISCFKKFIIVFGKNPLLWFLPISNFNLFILNILHIINNYFLGPSTGENGYYFRSLYL